MPDILQDLGYVAIGSRLKRLAERLQADALQIFERNGFVTQPSHFPLLAALDRYGPLSVGEAVKALGVSQPAVTRSLVSLVDLGLVMTAISSTDRRQKTISLTAAGIAIVKRMRLEVWPDVGRVVEEICANMDGGLLEQIERLETALSQKSLTARVKSGLSIVEYKDDLADTFFSVNEEWISSMFEMEDADRHILLNPRETIVDKGGVILFVSTMDLGIVGTCALMKIEPGCYELTKMGVLETARGRKAGEFLLSAILERARAMDIETLFLLTNQKCAPAIHLYEKLGFHHDNEIMRRFSPRYERCDVAMSYPLVEV